MPDQPESAAAEPTPAVTPAAPGTVVSPAPSTPDATVPAAAVVTPPEAPAVAEAVPVPATEAPADHGTGPVAKKHPAHLVVTAIVAVVVIGAAAGVAYYAYNHGKATPAPKAATISTTEAVKQASDVDSAMSSLDSGMSSLNTGLADQQGDLSE